ncbi:MAG: HAMP domain-containing histidine kinase [Bacteroidaceae bacterium]|nr:HAMP domain-containing histidine kinase [Bacteroidaceae bacterium]
MRKHITYITPLILTALLLGAIQACRNQPTQRKHVLIILTNDSQHSQYPPFIKEIQQTIELSGYVTDCRVLYMDLEYSPDAAFNVLHQLNDTLSKAQWKPDVIITEDDRSARILLADTSDKFLNVKRTPIVLGSISFPEEINLKGTTNICMWTNKIDFYENIKLAYELSGKNQVQIELDNYIYDVLIRRELNEAISRPPFVRNFDGALGVISDQQLAGKYKDSIVVTTQRIDYGWYDTRNPNDTILRRRELMRSFFKQSSKYPSLVVKKDVYCDAIANKSNLPQYTAITTDFADGMGSYLAGYFASYSTIAHDCGLSTARIFNGANPRSIGGQAHKKYFWMDYDAMQKMGMKYDDYIDKFRIVNAPFEIEHPTLYVVLVVAAILLILLILFGLWVIFVRMRGRLQEEKLEVIGRSRNISRLCLNSIENMPIETVDDIKKYISLAHPKSKKEIEKVRDSLDKPGSYSFLIYCAPKDDDKYQWWEFRYDITSSDVIGLIINKQEAIKLKERLDSATRNSREASRKEAFFNNLSNEMKKPLDVMCNACDRLINEKLSKAEREKVVTEMQESSEAVSQSLGDILLFSKIESGRLRYMITEKDAGEFLTGFYNEMAPKVPSHLNFVLVSGRSRVYAQADFDRLRNVMTQFMLNAIKFTREGSIEIGWRYYLDSHECEFFVEDTGIGIPAEAKDRLFDLFWKGEETSEGVGVGLNICRSLAEAMQGHISVGSIVGRGSRFSIWLPARALSQNQELPEQQGTTKIL